MTTPNDISQRLTEHMAGFWSTQVINAAVQLGVPDQLAAGPRSAAELAGAVGAHAPSLRRLLRAMQTLGLCRGVEEDRIELTPMGEPLQADAEGSVRGRALFSGGMLWKQFADLTHVVRTGERAPSGPVDFESLDPATLAVFQLAMAESSLKAAAEAAAVYDFGRFGSLLDVGGGFGGVLAFLLGRYRRPSGDVFDLPNVASGAQAFLEQAGLSGRARFIAGDFFKAVPAGYDAYLLKYILHDWNDADALTILRSCRAAVAPEARLVVLEQVVPDRLEDSFEHRAVIRGDLTMLAVGGKERTAEEYRDLLAGAGFALTSLTPTASTFSVIEAVPA